MMTREEIIAVDPGAATRAVYISQSRRRPGVNLNVSPSHYFADCQYLRRTGVRPFKFTEIDILLHPILRNIRLCSVCEERADLPSISLLVNNPAGAHVEISVLPELVRLDSRKVG